MNILQALMPVLVGILIGMSIHGAIMAYLAGRRGYSRLLWFFFGGLAGTFYTMFLLAALPSRVVERRRREELELLRRQLAAAGLPSSVSITPLPRGTIGDLLTVRSVMEPAGSTRALKATDVGPGPLCHSCRLHAGLWCRLLTRPRRSPQWGRARLPPPPSPPRRRPQYAVAPRVSRRTASARSSARAAALTSP